jgi:hypothetical protein
MPKISQFTKATELFIDEENQTEPNYFEFIKEFPSSLHLVPINKQSERIVMTAILDGVIFDVAHVAPHLLSSVFTEDNCISICKTLYILFTRIPKEYRTERVCIEMIKISNDAALYFFETYGIQTETICIEAVKMNPWLLRFVSNQTVNICLQAVSTTKYVYRYIKPEQLTREEYKIVTIEALKHTCILDRVKKELLSPEDYNEVLMLATSLYPVCLTSIEDADNTPEIVINAIKHDRSAIKYVNPQLLLDYLDKAIKCSYIRVIDTDNAVSYVKTKLPIKEYIVSRYITVEFVDDLATVNLNDPENANKVFVVEQNDSFLVHRIEDFIKVNEGYIFNTTERVIQMTKMKTFELLPF